ncbi:MAG: hypothetical protein L3K08_07795, partial [Thermoplasmata archaeon]|nr:hypothetical protein [Thermoplasmata archaeon]
RTPSFQTVDIPLAGPVAVLLVLLALPLALPSSLPVGAVAGPAISGHSDSLAPGGAHREGASPALTTRTVVSAHPRGPSPDGSLPRSASQEASDGLTVSIVSMPSTVDTGVTVTLVGQALGGEPPYTPEWSLRLGSVTSGWSVPWTSPNSPQTVNVIFEVQDRSNWVVTALGTIHVVASPFLELSGPVGLGDVGLPFLFHANVTGGVGPFALRWSLVNGSSNGSSTVPADGTYTGAVVPEGPGPMWVVGSVVDSWNRSFAATSPLGRATAPPSLIPASVPYAEVGYRTPISVGVADGTPPFVWSAAAVAGVSSESPADGTLASDGAIDLAVTFDHGGNYSLPLRLEDGSGAVVETNVTVAVAGGLNLSVVLASSTAVAGQPVGIVATISGGLPPYSYRIALSDNEQSAGNVSLPGPVRWDATPASAGYLTLRASVTDGTGRAANVTVTLYVATAAAGNLLGPAATGGSDALAFAGLGVGAGAALVGAFVVRRWWRWPKRAPPADPAERAGRTVIRELLAEADEGIDRATLDLLAEERHLTPNDVAGALASWQRAGRVRVEEAEDGREVVRWVATSPERPATSASPNDSATVEEEP